MISGSGYIQLTLSWEPEGITARKTTIMNSELLHKVKLCKSHKVTIAYFLIFLIISADIPQHIFSWSLLQLLKQTTEHNPICVDIKLLIPGEKAQRPPVQILCTVYHSTALELSKF